jgi:L-threonylcarbamoyladenylate synthase
MGTRTRRVSVIYFISKLVKWDDLRMEIISNPTQAEIKRAAQALKDGHLVAFPTETVYGLGADATNERAVSRIYSVKARPTDHPLIVHISSINQLTKWAIDIPEYAIKLARKFWPGPITFIVKRSDLAKDFVTGGQDSVGLRVPSHRAAVSLLTEFEKLGGAGIAAPSANRFGAVSATTAKAVCEDLGDYLLAQDIVLDERGCTIGVESTILDCTTLTPRILRPGAVTTGNIESLIPITFDSSGLLNEKKVSGNSENHYSPKARVILNRLANPGEGFLALSNIPTPEGAIRLSAPDTLEQYARDLYNTFRLADEKKLQILVVIPPDGQGLAVAIRNRLSKAEDK